MTIPTVSVSVIIPCFNNQDTIERALKSVEHQTARPLEVLVVDDASTDESREVVRRFAQNTELDVRLTALTANGGPARARNTAWDQARGDYIAFLDADDAWHPRKLELQYRVMMSDPSLIMSGHTYEVAFENKQFHDIDEITTQTYGCREALFKNRLPTPSVMILKDVNYRFDADKRHSEDYLLWLQVLLNENSSIIICEPLFRMFKRPYGVGGLSSQLYKAELAELEVYSRLSKVGAISRYHQISASVFSFLKYLRRIAVTVNIKR